MRKAIALFCSTQIVASITYVSSFSLYPGTLQGNRRRGVHLSLKSTPKALVTETECNNVIVPVTDVIRPLDEFVIDSVINSTITETSTETCDYSLLTSGSVEAASDVQITNPDNFDDDLWAKAPSASAPSDVKSKGIASSRRKTLISTPSMNKYLAFLAGVADVLCFSRHECYANMMTGNTIKLASATAGLKPVDSAFFGLLVFSYIVGFGVYRITDQVVQHSSDDSVSTFNKAENEVRSITPTVIAPFVFFSFALYDMMYKLVPQYSRWFVPILSIGSAAVNAAGLESTGAITCMMTGNLQKVGSHIADVFMSVFPSAPKVTKEAHRNARKPAMIVMFFTLGIFLANAAARLCNLAESATRTGSLLSSFVIALRQLPHFAILGGIYSMLLTKYSGPTKFKTPMQRLKELSWKPSGDSTEPCILDKYEAECLVEEIQEPPSR